MILDLNIKNSICLSPEMQQGLRVLSMSSAELEKEIEKELKDNYLLEDRGSYISESIPVVVYQMMQRQILPKSKHSLRFY